MSPRTGRPKADNPKNVDLKVRIDGTTHEKLIDYCNDNHVTKAEAVREGINKLLMPENKKTE